MSNKKYNELYIQCYDKVLDIFTLIKNFLYPKQYSIKRINETDMTIDEKLDYIKRDLENAFFTEEIGYEFTQLLEMYYPTFKADDDLSEITNLFYNRLIYLEEKLEKKYLPFFKNISILHYPEHDNKIKHSNEEIWELITCNKAIVEALERKIDDVIWAGVDSDDLESVIDEILKETYNLDEIEFNRYTNPGDINKSSIVRISDNTQKIVANFKYFDKYFENIFGQDEAVKQIKKVLKRSILFYNAENIGLESEVKERKTPLATFMFYGPTGTGKTESAKLIADFTYGDPHKLLILDMNSYKDSRIAASALKGHPEGYIDSNKGTDFTRFLASNEKGIIVLDEFEKADAEVREIFMTMLDEGEFKDALGKVYDLSGYIFIATTNASEKIENRTAKIGFATLDKEEEEKEEEKRIKDGLREIFTSPIMNRFNNLIHFKKISYEDALLISENLILSLKNKFENKMFNGVNPKITINNLDEICRIVLKECNFQKDGVRSLKNVINDIIGDGILEEIINNNDEITIETRNNKISIHKPVKTRR